MLCREKRWIVCLLTLLLLLSIGICPSSAAYRLIPAESRLILPDGSEIAISESCYLCTVEDGRDTLALIRTLEGERELWKGAYSDLQNSVTAIRKDMEAQIAEIREDLRKEREANQKQLKGLRRKVAAEKGKNLILVALLGGTIYLMK